MNKFNIKNYSTEVSGERSIREIEKMLTLFGAEAIIKEYLKDGTCYSLAFKIDDNAYKLPSNVKGVKAILYEGKRSYSGRDSEKKRDQRAYRVAWRILKDWIHSQLSLIASGQSIPEEVLLPYMYDGKRTLYQAYKEGKLLPPKNEKI